MCLHRFHSCRLHHDSHSVDVSGSTHLITHLVLLNEKPEVDIGDDCLSKNTLCLAFCELCLLRSTSKLECAGHSFYGAPSTERRMLGCPGAWVPADVVWNRIQVHLQMSEVLLRNATKTDYRSLVLDSTPN